MKYIVICRSDQKHDGTKGDYELATRRIFNNALAAEEYASSINPSREPVVVKGEFGQLRFTALISQPSESPPR